MKPRTRRVLLIAAATALWLGFPASHRDTCNPADYSTALTYFREEYAAVAPPSIPANANEVSFRFRWLIGLTKQRLILDASFRVPPNDALRILSEAKSKLPEWATNQSDEHRVYMEGGRDASGVEVDPVSGLVTVKLTHD